MPKKLVPAIERAFVIAFGAAMGGIILGVAWGSLMPVFPGVPNAVWILAGFFGLILVLGTIVAATHYDDEVTRLVEANFYPPDSEEIEKEIQERLRATTKEES